MDVLLEILKDFGFPIACVVACALFIYVQYKNQREDMLKRDEEHSKEVSNMTQTIERNTEAINAMNTSVNLILEHFRGDDS